jgi:nitrite reductase (NADH) large subunit
MTAPVFEEMNATGETPPDDRRTIVVIGNGMVGLRFCEKLIAADPERRLRIVTFCEEPRAAYDRVGLTTFFAHRDAEKLLLARKDWYIEHGVELHIGDRANAIDRQKRIVTSDRGREVAYDALVLATGSYPFVPPIPGIDKQGIFVYRTIEDLERMIAYAAKATKCAVIGGGLLGLEAAKAVLDLGLEAHVIEFSGRLMPRQIDDAGSRILVRRIEALGVTVHLNKGTKEVHGNGRIEALEFQDGSRLDVDMLVVSTGIRPRDELARQCGIDVGSRGGIVVNDQLRTSDPHIYAIGECALHAGMVYGLVAPGYEMADVLASVLTGGDRRFAGADLSTKLKLMGVDVASFGHHECGPDRAVPLSFEDPFAGKYKKLLFSPDGERPCGGHSSLATLPNTDNCRSWPERETNSPARRASSSWDHPPALSAPAPGASPMRRRSAPATTSAAGRSARRCAQTGAIRFPRSRNARRPEPVAGAACRSLPTSSRRNSGRPARELQITCAKHFAHSRTELFAIIKIKELKTFADVVEHCGRGQGCEVCKPAIASILASLWNDLILDDPNATLQDTNDRFLANIQRGGTYSVVPRVPGGEITPEKLIVLGEVAREFGLYTKITGGQRVDLFGARVQDLPTIWGRLIDAGFESGHAYGKALRTVKSCVGSTWCRFGVRDSVGFAIRIENRYKGIRAPHKIKMAVSGCVRECAEAQSKDVGLVATDKGYNLYVCGNGGARPRHADLLVADLDEESVIRYVDRFLMYYIMTADKLTRTSVWLEQLEGGLDHLREVILHDKLGLAGELEARLQHLVDTYQCEWAAIVQDPAKRQRFGQFVNTEESEPCIEIISQRGQERPADWPGELVSLEQFHTLEQSAPDLKEEEWRWVPLGVIADFPPDGGATVKYGGVQIAVFNFASRGEWYACQNMCPHKKAFVLGRGMIGDQAGIPKVACPLHKKTFSLEDGQSLQGEDYRLQTFPVRIEGERVLLHLPAPEALEASIGTEIGCRLASACGVDH